MNVAYMVYMLNMCEVFTVRPGKTDEGYFGNGGMKVYPRLLRRYALEPYLPMNFVQVLLYNYTPLSSVKDSMKMF